MLRFVVMTCVIHGAIASAFAAPVGQWVWSPKDVEVFAAARSARPGLKAAVHVADLAWREGTVQVQLRLSPLAVPGAAALAIRFEDSFHAAWAADRERMARATDDALRRILGSARAAGYSGTTLQLDYDAPVRRLASWATLLRTLRAAGAALEGWEVWITSLPAHVRDPWFGPLFKEVVAGHVVQVFDTRERYQKKSEAELRLALARAAIPFCTGVAGFERVASGRLATEHFEWLEAAKRLCEDPSCQGIWVFAAGQAWARWAGRL